MIHAGRLSAFRWRDACAVGVCWIVITTVATSLHWWVWLVAPGADGSPSIVEGSWPKEVSGLLMMMALPGWGFVSKVLSVPAAQSIPAAGASYAIGFGLWAIGLIVLLGCRRLWLDAATRQPAPVNLSRRRLLTDGPAAIAGLGGGTGLGFSVLVEPWELARAAYSVPIRGLPESLHGLRIVQLSDTHLGPRIPGWHIQRAVRMALDAQPDLVILTGDYIHNGARYIEHAAALFRPLTSAGIPTVGVLGNHDWFGDGPGVRAAMQRIGVRMVDNDRTFLSAARRLVESPSEEGLCIAGVGDLLEDVVDVDAALRGVAPQTPRLLLSHNPDVAEEIGPAHRVDLMFCGHTHGGQVRLPLLGTPWVPSRYGSKYAGGLVRGPACPVVISRGVGMSIMPVRFAVPPEVVEVVLTRA